jgi:hypothetical protein
MLADTFAIASDGVICDVVVNHKLSSPKLDSFLTFLFSNYAPLVIISENCIGGYAYTIAVNPEARPFKLDTFLKSVGKIEWGWVIEGNKFFSPRPSKITPNQLSFILKSSCEILQGRS